MDGFQREPELYFVESGGLAEIGRMLTWLGENCETFNLKLPTSELLTGADEPMSIQVAFGDRFEANAFCARFHGDSLVQ